MRQAAGLRTRAAATTAGIVIASGVALSAAVLRPESLAAWERYLVATEGVSTSTATKIAEVADAGTARERELPSRSDHGYLWRWNAYWRYEQASSGVIVECESVSLSRSLPSLLAFLRPIVDGTARESMDRTLRALRRAYADGG